MKKQQLKQEPSTLITILNLLPHFQQLLNVRKPARREDTPPVQPIYTAQYVQNMRRSTVDSELRSRQKLMTSRRNYSERKINYCCQAARFSPVKMPHAWYEDRGTIFKCHYCPKHKVEIYSPDSTAFKTRALLIAHLITEKLLDENSDPPFQNFILQMRMQKRNTLPKTACNSMQ